MFWILERKSSSFSWIQHKKEQKILFQISHAQGISQHSLIILEINYSVSTLC